MPQPTASFLPRAVRVARTFVLALLASCAALGAAATPVVGLPCEDCHLPMVGLPDTPPAVAHLAPADEPGERLHLTGRVTDADGKPRPGVVVYANQTDAQGVYPGAGRQADAGSQTDAGIRGHGRLRAWTTSDADGRYTFLTIRPGSYPGSTMPQHIHLYVIEAGCALYYIDDVLFSDDPHLTPSARRRADQGRGGGGIVTPVRTGDGWLAHRDIVLGRNIPGYPGCAP